MKKKYTYLTFNETNANAKRFYIETYRVNATFVMSCIQLAFIKNICMFYYTHDETPEQREYKNITCKLITSFNEIDTDLKFFKPE